MLVEITSNAFSSSNSNYTSLPTWVESALPSPQVQEQFDLSPVTPGLIKSILKRRKHASAPGEDNIVHTHLKKLPCSHFMATLFTQILLYSQSSPPSWSSGKIILIHKAGSTDVPLNYHPIILSSVRGKLFLKVIAMIEISDPSIQKKTLLAFLRICVNHC